MQLLKPLQVSEKLGISVATVYQRSKVLGGFYPFGIKSLRFDEDFINGMLERQKAQALVLSLSGEQGELQRKGLQHKEGCTKSSSSSSGSSKKGGNSVSFNRHGLFSSR